jgi:hypothetical protein
VAQLPAPPIPRTQREAAQRATPPQPSSASAQRGLPRPPAQLRAVAKPAHPRPRVRPRPARGGGSAPAAAARRAHAPGRPLCFFLVTLVRNFRETTALDAPKSAENPRPSPSSSLSASPSPPPSPCGSPHSLRSASLCFVEVSSSPLSSLYRSPPRRSLVIVRLPSPNSRLALSIRLCAIVAPGPWRRRELHLGMTRSSLHAAPLHPSHPFTVTSSPSSRPVDCTSCRPRRDLCPVPCTPMV